MFIINKVILENLFSIYMEKISKIFNIPPNKINKDLVKYFDFNVKYNKCNHNEKPLFDDVKEFDFSNPINKLIKYYNSEHFKKLLNTKINLNNIYANSSDNIQQIDEIMYYYSLCRPNTRIITCWDRVTHEDVLELIELLKKNGNVYYVRKFRI